MPVQYGERFGIEFDRVFQDGAVILGTVEAVMEFQSREDRAKGRPVRYRVDERTGLRLFKVTVSDPSAARDADKSVQVFITAEVQPVPPEGTEVAPGIVVRPVVFEGMTVEPRVEGTGEFKRLGYVLRATGMRAPSTKPTPRSSTSSESRPSPTGEGRAA